MCQRGSFPSAFVKNSPPGCPPWEDPSLPSKKPSCGKLDSLTHVDMGTSKTFHTTIIKHDPLSSGKSMKYHKLPRLSDD